jgi:hypothetical protein
MNELKDTAPKQPMDRSRTTSDDIVMRDLVGLLNNPAITGAEVPRHPPPLEKPAELPMPVVAAPVAAIEVKQVFFTGGPRVGKSWLAERIGAEVFEFEDPIHQMARTFFGAGVNLEDTAGFVKTLVAWGEGTITATHPLTAERGAFLNWFRQTAEQWKDTVILPPSLFGTPDFWTRSLIARVKQFQAAYPGKLIAVTRVDTVTQHKMLSYVGFRPYHVLCNSITQTARGGRSQRTSLTEGIERDITRKLSESPQGKKLWAVWCDDRYPSPSPRLMTIDEFTQAIRG